MTSSVAVPGRPPGTAAGGSHSGAAPPGLRRRFRRGAQRFGGCFVFCAGAVGLPLAFVLPDLAFELTLLALLSLAAVVGALLRRRDRIRLWHAAAYALCWFAAFGLRPATDRWGGAVAGPVAAEYWRQPRPTFWDFLRSDLVAFWPALAIVAVAAVALLVVRNRLEAGTGGRARRFLSLLRLLDGGPDNEPPVWSPPTMLPGLSRR